MIDAQRAGHHGRDRQRAVLHHRPLLPRAPTARIAACGGLMIAANSDTPNMPMLEIEKPPPWNSSGFSLPARARPARSFISRLIVARPFWSAWRMIGVISPSGIDDGDADVDVVVEHHAVVGPAGVHRRARGAASPPAALITRSLIVMQIRARRPPSATWRSAASCSSSSASISMSIDT